MADILGGILSQLGNGGLSQIAGALGADEDKAGDAIAMALPALLGGMAKNTQSPDGANALAGALDKHDGGVFGQLTDLLGNQDGSKILGHVLGSKTDATQQRIAAGSGLDVGSVAKLLPMLAPLVMGYLGKQKKEQNLGATDLAGALQNERNKTEEKAPGLGGLAAILDTDGDGLDLDDVKNLASGSGGLGGLLGSFLKR